MSHHQSSRRERWQGDTDGASASASATSWFPAGAALGAAGLATASTAITCMAISEQSSDPPPAALFQQGNDDSSCCYLLALSGLFYSGIAELGAAVWVMAEPRGRVVAGRRLVYASLVPLTAAVGLLAAATLFW
ncbi:uncharacterized protein [Miscanthus floridulus]|uniref:uncharacterized protein n=1 Tax=Miscanthus floridulus TaxID=154761 RepID=UPI00345AF29E